MPLKLDKVSRRYDDKWVLRDFSPEAIEGEIFGLIGANGAGKSAALRLIAGREKPNSGQIFFNGNDVTNDSAKTRNYTLLAEEENQSAWKNLFKPAKSDALSGGERLTNGFEKALRQAENVLLLDNPFACLDPISREESFEKLRKTAQEKNLIVVLAINDFEAAFLACDRLGVLHKGEIVQTGTPRELYEQPNSVAVAALLGRNNLIAARRVTFNNQPIPEFQTLTGDHRLQTGKMERIALGTITSDVTLMIRPEHISISFGASFPEDNLLKAKIVGVQYCGATTRVKLDAGGLMLEALVLRLVGLNLGDECLVGLPPDRILVLKR
ncbi:MAG TPA: ABC transporter ATP-binding protein [Pyrinomonadaceae bacterium]|jgi:ABC-type Fe3+/spermidine/putrescine transport system ATPase subunit